MESFDSIILVALISLAFFYLILGLDDLFIDIIALKHQLKPTELTPEEKNNLFALKQKKIAVVIPAWNESNIISKMLRGNLAKISYDNYHIFVGCYPNDLPTFREISKVAQETHRVTPILNTVAGPTSKGQLLNSVLHELFEGNHPRFDIYVFQDAEDIIHPLSLRLINSEADRADFIQIPVFSLPVKNSVSIGATYMDEFAETHTRDLLVRKCLGVSIPSAGVGFALTYQALAHLIQSSSSFEVFDSGCLTEDYVLGIRSAQAGLKQSFACFFQRENNGPIDWIATYEYFPKHLLRSIRQKARWTQGIALQSPKRLGWFGSVLNCFFLFRDRKALLANCLGFLGIFLLPLAFLSTFEHPWVGLVCGLNTVLILNRLCQRTRAVKRVYLDASGIEVLLRYPLGILVNGLAGFLALKNYSRSVFLRQSTTWVKTDHELPEGFGQSAA